MAANETECSYNQQATIRMTTDTSQFRSVIFSTLRPTTRFKLTVLGGPITAKPWHGVSRHSESRFACSDPLPVSERTARLAQDIAHFNLCLMAFSRAGIAYKHYRRTGWQDLDLFDKLCVFWGVFMLLFFLLKLAETRERRLMSSREQLSKA